MPPTTRSQSQQESYSGHDSDQDSDGSDTSVDDGDGRGAPLVVRSPNTDISYDISNLDRKTQKAVRRLFRAKPVEGAPQLVLQWCKSFADHDGHFYAFAMLETVRVHRSIRIGSPENTYRKPQCSCTGDSERPCNHLIYLLDQVNYHTADHQSRPLEHLGLDGYATELGHPFEKISDFHLDQLATSLHCDLESEDPRSEVNPAHLQEVREILASVMEPDLDDHAFERFRPDIFDNLEALPDEGAVISYGDLTHTVANMLVKNKEFFAYFLRLLDPSSRARDPFRKIQQRVDRVLGDLDAFSRDQSGAPTFASATEGNRDVPWAAAHVERAVSTIQALLQYRSDAPSSSTERANAARALVTILYTIVFSWNREVTLRPATITSASGSGSGASPSPAQPAASSSLNERNLYHRLIGGKTHGPSAFVIDVLAQLPEQNQWIETLEEIEDQLSTYAPPAEYLGRLRELILLMRSSRPAPAPDTRTSGPGRRGGGGAAGRKRSRGGGNGREGGAKRVK
ncbi:hypothetical protein diail_3891 [Diaporthe ilicicola]|nr:hypothetical protein diail_3891 [Diaporthe ilicicola]